jgi:hypothetical protein
METVQAAVDKLNQFSLDDLDSIRSLYFLPCLTACLLSLIACPSLLTEI